MPKLTALTVENFKPQSERKEIPDAGCTGLYLVVQPSGSRSYAVRYRYGGKPKKLTLSRGLSLKQARAAATAALEEIEKGIDPSAAKRMQKQAQGLAEAKTLRAIAEKYLEREGKKKESERLRSLDYQDRLMQRLVYPTIGDMPIDKIKRGAINDLLDKIEDNNGPRMAHSTLAVIRKVMGWHAVRDGDYSSPIVRGMARINAKARERSRVLNDDELRSVWRCAEQRADPFARLVQFLLLTGARRNEAACMTWKEIEGTDWILPASRNKVKVELVRPLSKAAMAVVKAQPAIQGCPFVFTYGRGAAAGASRHKRTFDAASGVVGWTLHDLRRSARSLMSRAGVLSEHAKRCLGHTVRGVEATYDRYDYRVEKQKAFEALAALIELIVNPPGANVHLLHAAQ
jgi:integrase